MGKKLLLLAAVMLILPSAVWADSMTDFFFYGGTVSGTDSSLSVTGGTVYGVSNFNSPVTVGANLGSVSFATGARLWNNPEGSTYLPGGSFVITGSGSNGIPAGTLFSGAFQVRSTWTPLTLADGSHVEVMHGSVDGNWLGQSVTDAPMELFMQVDGPALPGGGHTIRGSIFLPAKVPEPGSAAFLLLGIVGLGGSLLAKRQLADPSA